MIHGLDTILCKAHGSLEWKYLFYLFVDRQYIYNTITFIIVEGN